jgi:hypothetical protein
LTLDRALQPIENICQWHIWHIDIKNRIVWQLRMGNLSE